MTDNLQDKLDASREKHGIAGASVALYENGELSTAASGVINVTTGVALTTDTVMHIGSITKVFNATLLMQLVDEGLVELDRPVLDYLPDLRTADMDALAKITVAMLVNHQSGIDGVIIPDRGPDRERILDAVLHFTDLGQVHEPGADVSYCNVACVIAGYLCERVKGKSWYTLVEEQIFKPLGMDHAIVQPANALLHRSSVGHYLDPATGKPVRTSFPFLPQSFAPAGGTAMMTASDLVTFARMHLNDGVGPNGTRVLSEASAKLMREKTGTYGGPMKMSFGLGWMLIAPTMVGHGGGGPGILSYLIVDPASDAAIAVLTNNAEGMLVIADMANAFLAARGGEPMGGDFNTDAGFTIQRGPIDTAPFTGIYEGVTTLFRIEDVDGALVMKITEKTAYYESMTTNTVSAPLSPAGDGVFIVGLGIPMFENRPVGFINPDANGRMQHFAPGGALYRRTG